MANHDKFVRVPLVIVNALMAYLSERPYKESRPFIEVFEGLPVETAPAAPLHLVAPLTAGDPPPAKPGEGAS